MAHWLLKTEPTVYSYDDLVREQKTVWNGVSNNLALKHLRAMNPGDLAFIYHTGEEKSIVGIAEIVSSPYPDPNGGDPRLVVVDLKPKQRLSNPVPLSVVKARKELAAFPLVRLSRLSAMPVTPGEWKLLLSMSK